MLPVDLSGCRRQRMELAAELDAEPVERPLMISDPAYAGEEKVTAQRWTMLTQMNQPALNTFATLSEDQKAQFTNLKLQSALKFEVLGSGNRFLVDFPAAHPLGKAQLLLDDELDTIFVFMPEKKVRYLLPRERLPDIFDCAEASDRQDLSLIFHDEAPLPSEQRAQAQHRIWSRQAEGTMTYSPLHESKGTPMRLILRVAAEQPGLRPVSRPPFPWPLLAPWLESEHGRVLLDYLVTGLGEPVQWTATIINENKPAVAPFMAKTQLQRLGSRRLQRHRLSYVREGYRDSRVFDECSSAGRQLLQPSALTLLRESKSEGDLWVNNRANTPLLIYADGLLLGWIGADQEFSFTGMPAGFYRLYATNFSGTRTVGPTDLYIPGPWTLR